MQNISRIGIALGVLLISSGSTALGQSAHPCLPAVDAEIARVQLDPSRIDRITFGRQVQTLGENNRTVGYDGWVRLNDCGGSMIVDLDTRCNVRQTYVRGMCGVAGVKTFD